MLDPPSIPFKITPYSIGWLVLQPGSWREHSMEQSPQPTLSDMYREQEAPLCCNRHWEFGIVHYCSLTKPNLIIPSFGFTHEMFSGFLSQGNWEEKEEDKSPQHATTGLGGLCRCELFFFSQRQKHRSVEHDVHFFMFPKKRNDFSDPGNMGLCHYPIKKRKIFFFLEWLNPSSYLLGKWLRLDEVRSRDEWKEDYRGPLLGIWDINTGCDGSAHTAVSHQPCIWFP